jgi:nicotinic acid phosphoribosyltransferase
MLSASMGTRGSLPSLACAAATGRAGYIAAKSLRASNHSSPSVWGCPTGGTCGHSWVTACSSIALRNAAEDEWNPSLIGVYSGHAAG